MDENWPRWIFASVSKHFDDNKQGIPMYIEGQHRNTKDIKDFFELRMDGPQFTEISKNSWDIYVEINCLVQSAMDDTNYHRIHQNVGIVAAAFTNIRIFKYGDGPGDDESLIGCLKLIQDKRKRHRLDIFHFGQIEVSTELVQATVEGHYKMNKEVT